MANKMEDIVAEEIPREEMSPIIMEEPRTVDISLIVGKRFYVRDVADLNRQLAQHNLVSNLNADGSGDRTVTRLVDERERPRYSPRYSVLYYAKDDSDGMYNVVVGRKMDAKKATARNGEIAFDDRKLFFLEQSCSLVEEVQIDIRDARIFGMVEESYEQLKMQE